MSILFPGTKPKPTPETDLQRARTGLRVVQSGIGIAKELHSGNPQAAIQRAIISGIKLATSIFYEPTASVLKLANAIKIFGIEVLTWAPETLCAEIDRKYGGWTDEQVAQALESFQSTGIIRTDIPSLVRQKIYAIRVVATSDSAQTEWNIFEKVGGAFNDRTVNFSQVEQMSAAECAKTVAVIENIRPDSYTNEIKIYIAACCHEDGLYTIEPIKWLAMSEPHLQQMNFESTGEHVDAGMKQKIIDRFSQYKQNPSALREITDDLISVQAAKLLAIDSLATESLSD